MAIVRAPRPQSNFYLLDKSISEDKRLSWAARGLLVYLLGKPDNWQVSVKALMNETAGSAKKTGRDGVYALLNELIDAGYVRRTQGNGAGGFKGTDYLVSESPLPENTETVEPLPAEPLPESPYTAEPYPSNPTQVSIEDKQGLNTEQGLNKNNKALAAASRPVKPKFDLPDWVPADLWADYIDMRKKIRKPATERAMKLAIRDLEKMAREGQDPAAVLEQSILNSWQGLFPVRGTQQQGSAQQKFDPVAYNHARSRASFEAEMRTIDGEVTRVD